MSIDDRVYVGDVMPGDIIVSKNEVRLVIKIAKDNHLSCQTKYTVFIVDRTFGRMPRTWSDSASDEDYWSSAVLLKA